MNKPYFILVERDDNGRWSMEFGDYVRAVVEDERRDVRDHGIKAKDLKVIRLETDTQAAIETAVEKLNATH